jgi:hypothetical protein
MAAELSFTAGMIGVQISRKNQPVMSEAFRIIPQFIQTSIGTVP